jgi:hypothetical protein
MWWIGSCSLDLRLALGAPFDRFAAMLRGELQFSAEIRARTFWHRRDLPCR